MQLIDFLMGHPFVINAVIGVLLLVMLFRVNSPYSVMLIIFIYTSFHFGFGYLPSFYEDFYQKFHEQREVSHFLVSVIGLIFLLSCLLKLIYMSLGKYASIRKKSDKMFNIIIIEGFLISLWLIGQGYLVFFSDHYVLHDVFIQMLLLVSALIMLRTFLLYPYLQYRQEYRAIVNTLAILACIMLALQLVQIILGRTFVCCAEFRPDALLFNPNVLSFWCLSLIIFYSFIFTLKYRQTFALLVVSLLTVGFFLTAARAMVLAYLGFVIIAALLLWANDKVLFLRHSKLTGLVFGELVILMILPQFLGHIVPSSFWLKTLQIDSERLLFLPPILVKYLTGDERMLEFLSKHTYQYFGSDISTPLSYNGMSNISNRLSLLSTDNMYVYLFNSQGLAMVLLWCLIICCPILFGIFALRRCLDKAQRLVGVYLITYLIMSMFVAISMRLFMNFPSFVYMAMIFAFILAWLTSNDVSYTHNKDAYSSEK